MSQGQGMRIGWGPRPEPLTPIAALVPRHQARVLLTRDITDDTRALSTGDSLVLLAASEHLPWCPQVRYFGRDELAPSLLVPTNVAPTIPIDLFERCIRLRYRHSGPILVDPKAQRVIGLTAERPLTPDALRRFIDGGDA